MKRTLRLFAFIMAIAALCSFNTFAVASTDISEELPDGLTLVEGEPIGSLADDEGFKSANIESRAVTATGLPFSMTATGVQELLTTYYSGKSFTGGAFDALSGEGLLITGSLTHTQDKTIKIGACYYEISKDTFHSVMPSIVDSGEQIKTWTPKMSGQKLYFGNSTTYYGHITNYSGTGSVSGNLYFSVSTSPW